MSNRVFQQATQYITTQAFSSMFKKWYDEFNPIKIKRRYKGKQRVSYYRPPLIEGSVRRKTADLFIWED